MIRMERVMFVQQKSHIASSNMLSLSPKCAAWGSNRNGGIFLGVKRLQLAAKEERAWSTLTAKLGTLHGNSRFKIGSRRRGD